MIDKVYGGFYEYESGCEAYWDDDSYNFYEGSDLEGKKLRGCIAGPDYQYIFNAIPYSPKREDGLGCYGYTYKDENFGADYVGIMKHYTDDIYRHIGYLYRPDSLHWGVMVWRPEYSGYSYVGFVRGIPAVGAAYVILMENDLNYHSDLYYYGHKWKTGSVAPEGTPPKGTVFLARNGEWLN